MKLLGVIAERHTQVARPRNAHGRAMSAREVLMARITARRGAHG